MFDIWFLFLYDFDYIKVEGFKYLMKLPFPIVYLAKFDVLIFLMSFKKNINLWILNVKNIF